MPSKGAFPVAFKPPRPIGATVPERASTSKPVASFARPVLPTSNKSSRHNVLPSSISSISDEDLLDVAETKTKSKPGVRTTAAPDRGADTSTDEPPESIPPKLLITLLHEHFGNPETRITKEAMALFVKYVDTFAAEAIARAIAERREAQPRNGGGGLAGVFLEVEDLEKLTPQLLLDF